MFFNRPLRTNVYLAFFIRISIIYILFSICRGAFFLYNAKLFGDLSSYSIFWLFIGGLKYDTAAIIYVNALYILMQILPLPWREKNLYQSIGKYLYLTTNSIAIFVNLADVVYFPYTMRRTTASVFEQFAHETNMGGLAVQFAIDFWPVLVLFALISFLLFYTYRMIEVVPMKVGPWRRYLVGTAVFLACAFLLWGGVRGGFLHSTRPLSLADAGAFVSKPVQMAVVQNTPFALIRTMGKQSVKQVQYMPEEERRRVYDAYRPASKLGRIRKKNVVLIILESWSREFVGSLNRDLDSGNYRGYTPFFDSLIGESRSYKYAFANGRKSIEALPSAVASIPSMEVPYVLSHESNNTINSLATELGSLGYRTAFFHGAPNGSMGFNAFMNIAGVGEYYGKTEYADDADYDGIWGIWDEEFLQYYAQTMNTYKEPFFTSVFTVSSHHPYAIPQRYETTFAKGEVPLIRCLGYTDMALRKFFETAKKMPWYENTLFVLTADHSSFPLHPDFTNDLGTFCIPLVFHCPDGSLRGMDTVRVAQQIDIMPTVLDWLGYDKPFISFGKDLFDPSSPDFAVNYMNGYQIVSRKYFMQFNGADVTGLYQYKTDRRLKNNLVNTGIPEQDTLSHFLKAFIQDYNRRIVKDSMSVKK